MLKLRDGNICGIGCNVANTELLTVVYTDSVLGFIVKLVTKTDICGPIMWSKWSFGFIHVKYIKIT